MSIAELQELKYDVLVLPETHDTDVCESGVLLTAEKVGGNDPWGGVAMLLSPRMAKAKIGGGKIGSRLVWARFKVKGATIFVIGIYVAHMFRTQTPFREENYDELRQILTMIPVGDIPLILGDFNSRLARNIKGITGRWSIHKRTDSGGEILEKLCSQFGLVASSTFFRPSSKNITGRS